MKKTYFKPDAEYIEFYPEETITADLPLEDIVGGEGISVNNLELSNTEKGWT